MAAFAPRRSPPARLATRTALPPDPSVYGTQKCIATERALRVASTTAASRRSTCPTTPHRAHSSPRAALRAAFVREAFRDIAACTARVGAVSGEGRMMHKLLWSLMAAGRGGVRCEATRPLSAARRSCAAGDGEQYVRFGGSAAACGADACRGFS